MQTKIKALLGKVATVASLMALISSCGGGGSDNAAITSRVQVSNKTPNNISSVEIQQLESNAVLYKTGIDCTSLRNDCYFTYIGAAIDTPANLIFKNKDNVTVAAYKRDNINNNAEIFVSVDDFTISAHIIEVLKQKYPEYKDISHRAVLTSIANVLPHFAGNLDAHTDINTAISNAYNSKIATNVSPQSFSDELNNHIINKTVMPAASFAMVAISPVFEYKGCTNDFKTFMDVLSGGATLLGYILPEAKQVGSALDKIQQSACPGAPPAQNQNKEVLDQLAKMQTVLESINNQLAKSAEDRAELTKSEVYAKFGKLDESLNGLYQGLNNLTSNVPGQNLLAYVKQAGGLDKALAKEITNDGSLHSLMRQLNTTSGDTSSLYGQILDLSNPDDLSGFVTTLNSICGDKAGILSDIILRRQSCNIALLTVTAKTIALQNKLLGLFNELYPVYEYYQDNTHGYAASDSLENNLNAVLNKFKLSQDNMLATFKSKIFADAQLKTNGQNYGLYNVYGQLPSYLMDNYKSLNCSYITKTEISPALSRGKLPVIPKGEMPKWVPIISDQSLTTGTFQTDYYPAYDRWIRTSNSEYLETTCYSASSGMQIDELKDAHIKARYLIYKNNGPSDYSSPPNLVNAFGVLINNGFIPHQLASMNENLYYQLGEDKNLRGPVLGSYQTNSPNSLFLYYSDLNLPSLPINQYSPIFSIDRYGLFFAYGNRVATSNTYVRYTDYLGYSYVYALLKADMRSETCNGVTAGGGSCKPGPISVGLACVTKECSMLNNYAQVLLDFDPGVPRISFELSHLGSSWYFSINGSPQTQ